MQALGQKWQTAGDLSPAPYATPSFAWNSHTAILNLPYRCESEPLSAHQNSDGDSPNWWDSPRLASLHLERPRRRKDVGSCRPARAL